MKIAADIKDWDEVKNYISKNCIPDEEAFICLLITMNLLERFDGLTKRAQELLLEMEDTEFGERILQKVLNESLEQFPPNDYNNE